MSVRPRRDRVSPAATPLRFLARARVRAWLRPGWIALGMAGLMLAAVVAAAPAHALETQLIAFSKRPDASGQTRVIVHLSGPVTNDAFQRLFGGEGEGLLSPDRWAPKSIIYLESQGGNVDEAIRIGEEFRRRGLWTAVRPNNTCASACVTMLMGGERRWLEVGALIVIHAPEVKGTSDDARRGRMLDSLKSRLITLSAEANVDRALVDNMFATPAGDPRLVRDTEAAMWGLASDFGDPFGPFLFTEPVAFPTPAKG